MTNHLYQYQRDIVRRILDNYDSYNYFFISSPTGTGKTLIGLSIVRELLWSGRIRCALWFTRTHNEYYPIIRDIRKFGLKTIRPLPIIGKNKLCDSPLRSVASELGEHINICKLCHKQPYKYAQDLIDKIIGDGIDKALDTIPRMYCKYLTLWELTPYANLVLLTYPYLIGNPRRKLDRNIDYQLIIVDEAHNLESINHYISCTLKLDHIQHLIMKGYNLRPLLQLWENIYSKYMDKEIHHIDKGLLVGIFQTIDKRIFKLYRDVLNYPSLFEDKTIKSITALIRFMGMIDNPLFELFIYKNGFKLLNTDIHMLVKSIFNKKAILMSGTLPSPEYINNVWGLDGLYIDVVKEYEIRFGERTWVWSREVSTKLAVRHKYLPIMRQYINKILGKADPIVFIVFPSYDYMKSFIDIANKYQCIVESEYGTKIEDVISRVKSEGIKCIFAVAGGRLTEGIEITEDGRSMIKTIVLVGVPYPVPNDLLKRKAYHITKRLQLDRSKYYYFIFHVPALISSKQAIGRGIRHREDKNIIFLLDWRFHHFFGELGVDKYIEVKLKKKRGDE